VQLSSRGEIPKQILLPVFTDDSFPEGPREPETSFSTHPLMHAGRIIIRVRGFAHIGLL
jgi:hypothetical protein